MKIVFTPIGLRARREALGLTQADLARVLGVSALTLHRWEAGQRAPVDHDQVEQMLVSLEAFMGDIVQALCDSAERQADDEREASIHVFRDDQQWHAVDALAAEHGLPVSFYRIAAARAAATLRENLGVTVRIYTV